MENGASKSYTCKKCYDNQEEVIQAERCCFFKTKQNARLLYTVRVLSSSAGMCRAYGTTNPELHIRYKYSRM